MACWISSRPELRHDPDASGRGNTLHLGIFDEVFSGKELCFFDETVWIPQTPNEDCPLCGGAPDITALKGKLRDTVCIGGVGMELSNFPWRLMRTASG